MKEFQIIKVSKNFDWNKIPSVDLEYSYRTPVPEIKASAKLCYDDDNLYVLLSAIEKNIRAEEMIPYGESCNDSCLEFFFCPVENDPRYFNIEFTPNKCMFLGYGSGLSDLLRLIPDYSDNIFDAKTIYSEKGWEIEYKIPYSFIKRFFPDFKVYSGKRMKANFYKCGDKTLQPHYLSWSKINADPYKTGFTFHRTQDFGIIIF